MGGLSHLQNLKYGQKVDFKGIKGTISFYVDGAVFINADSDEGHNALYKYNKAHIEPEMMFDPDVKFE